MRKHYAVDGRLPKGKRFRGVVATTANDVVLAGPQCLCDKPWDKRPLTIPELRKFSKVEKCAAPILCASVEEQLEHKFQTETCLTNRMWKRSYQRAQFLMLVESIRAKMERDA